MEIEKSLLSYFIYPYAYGISVRSAGKSTFHQEQSTNVWALGQLDSNPPFGNMEACRLTSAGCSPKGTKTL